MSNFLCFLDHMTRSRQGTYLRRCIKGSSAGNADNVCIATDVAEIPAQRSHNAHNKAQRYCVPLLAMLRQILPVDILSSEILGANAHM